MKKLLSLVLVLVLALGSFSFATPSDVVGTNYATAVDRLMALELLTGYPDGTFKPAATITRAEFAAVVVRALGLGSAASVSSPTKFSDVPATHWASGYISVAAGLGVINGHTDGTFKPADPVTYEQAVAMVVRALGYEPSVATKGGFPAGHLIVASDLDILDGVKGAVGAPAPRGLVAILVDNALEAKLMEQVEFGDEVKYAQVNKTLLTDKLGLEVIEEKYVTDVDSDFTEFDIEGKVLKAAAGVTVSGLDDLQVTVWYDADTNIAYVVKVHSTVYYDYVDVNTDTVVTLYNAGKDIKVADDYDLTVDGVDVVLDGDANGGDGNLATGLFGKFILNKDGKLVNTQLYSNLNQQGIVKAVTEKQLKYTNSTATTVTVNGMDDADYKLVVVDGKAATYADLKEGMFVEYRKNADDEFIIAANSGKFDGVFTSMRADRAKITIGGTVYNTSNTYGYEGASWYSEDNMDTIDQITASDSLENFESKTVTAYKDNMGNIWLVNATVDSGTKSFYGFLKLSNSFNDQIKVVRNVDGTAKTVTYTYDLADASDNDEADLAAYATNNFGDVGGAAAMNDYYKFYINSDNEITKIMDYTALAAAEVDEDEVSKTNDSFLSVAANRYFGGSDVLIWDIATDATDPTIVTWNAFENADLDGVDFLTDAYDMAWMVVVGGNGIGSSTDYILAYAATAPTLAGGKYTGTVNTVNGSLDVIVDDSDIENWTNSRRAILFTQDGTEYVVEVSERANANGVGFVTTDGLATLEMGDFLAEYDVVADIDGQYITFDNIGTYKVATNAMIYLQEDLTTYSVADLSFMEADDQVVFIAEDGIIKLMFFIDDNAAN